MKWKVYLYELDNVKGISQKISELVDSGKTFKFCSPQDGVLQISILLEED